MNDILIGIDAGTSMIKCAAFSVSGELLASRSRANRYDTSPDGAAVQSLPDTRDALVDTLGELVDELGPARDRVRAAAVTAQGDGTWLVDENNEALHDGWLWLDSRAADIVTELEGGAGCASVFATTGNTLNASQMRSQMLWMERHQPELLDAAATAYHCKDYLYACLTGHRATDPSEALLSFGSFRRGEYAPEVLRTLGLDGRAHLLPPIVDGCREAHPLLDSVARGDRSAGRSARHPGIRGRDVLRARRRSLRRGRRIGDDADRHDRHPHALHRIRARDSRSPNNPAATPSRSPAAGSCSFRPTWPPR